jgi:hypothetical protein
VVFIHRTGCCGRFPSRQVLLGQSMAAGTVGIRVSTWRAQ